MGLFSDTEKEAISSFLPPLSLPSFPSSVLPLLVLPSLIPQSQLQEGTGASH